MILPIDINSNIIITKGNNYNKNITYKVLWLPPVAAYIHDTMVSISIMVEELGLEGSGFILIDIEQRVFIYDVYMYSRRVEGGMYE